MAAGAGPTEIARETIRQLALRRLAPTPEHYARVYREIGGLPEDADGAEAQARFLRELAARLLTDAVVPRLGYSEALAEEARAIAARLREARDMADLRAEEKALRQFWIHLELRGQTQADVLAAALALLQLAVRNLGELVADERWVGPQVARMEKLLAAPPDVAAMREVERGLRAVIVRQGAMRKQLEQAQAALREMVSAFIERIGALGAATGAYSERVAAYARRIGEARDLAGLAGLVSELLADTREMQTDLLRSREELVEARRRVQAQQARIAELEKELETVAGLVREDALTGALNRRGLEEAFAAECARAERRGEPLALAVLDLDNFKALNDRLGHQAGDAALAHLARVARQALRPTDVVTRYGGEEFVILLPGSDAEEAARVVARVQHALTRHLFRHHEHKVLITFSAGVAERRPGETREALIARADAAMYEAKRSGKNRVVVAA
ncbi:MAG: GGDEF domain-containing protein [Burkholderiales bacterium]|nr:GGDEF domain-containing protein [Burkholderiales bacterium]